LLFESFFEQEINKKENAVNKTAESSLVLFIKYVFAKLCKKNTKLLKITKWALQ
jgi:hypothetical protein